MGLTITFLKPQVNILICGVNGIDWTNAVQYCQVFPEWIFFILHSHVFHHHLIFFLSNAEMMVYTIHCISVNVQKVFQKVGLNAGFRMMIAWGLSTV